MEGNLHSHGKWWNKTKQWIQKQYFNVTHTIDLNVNDQTDHFVNVFGHQFTENQEARVLYSSILWFTYRENLQFSCSDITSDVGWGCMLRVGQMVIAQALRRSEGIQSYGDPQKVNRIISLFDGNRSLFSVQAMTNKGMQIFNKGPGSWFTPAEAATIIKQLQNSDSQSQLRVLVYNNQFETSSALQTLRETNFNKRNEITQVYIKRNKQKIDHNSEISIFPGLIIILARIGIDHPEPQMLESILQLMKLPSFMGILGGKTSLAHYIVGFTNKNFIYLDPHYVKENTGKIQDYFGSSMFCMPHEKVDTSMGICFFVKDYGEFVRLADDLMMLKNKVFYSHSLLQQSNIVQISSCEKFQILDER